MPIEIEENSSLGAIRSTLDLFQECFAGRRLEARNALQKCEAAQAALQTAKIGAGRKIEELQERNKFLQQRAYEELKPISGIASASFSRTKPLQRTPDFHFALKTKWPIRSALVDPPYDPERWKPFPSYTGATDSFEFVATLKNKRYHPAKARVRLLGWRHEIHQKEIAENSTQIGGLRKQQSELMKQLTEMVMKTRMCRAQLDAFEIKLEDVQRDKEALERGPAPLDMDGQPEQNIYTICQAYGLTTTIESFNVPPFLQTKLTSQQSSKHLESIQNLQDNVSSHLKTLDDQRLALHDMRQDDIALLRSELVEMILELKPSDLTYLQSVVTKGKSPEGSIARRALESLGTLDIQTKAFISKHESKFCEHDDNLEERLNQAHLGETIDELNDYLVKDLEAIKSVRPLIGKTSVGVPAATYLLAKDSAVEGWTDLLDDLSRHMDLQATVATDDKLNDEQDIQDAKVQQSESHAETSGDHVSGTMLDVLNMGVRPASKVKGMVRVTTSQVSWASSPIQVWR